MKVICIDNNGWIFNTKGFPELLTTGKVYEVLNVDDDKYSIIVNDGSIKNLRINRFKPHNREKNLEILILE